jgi:hypothetical protein
MLTEYSHIGNLGLIALPQNQNDQMHRSVYRYWFYSITVLFYLFAMNGCSRNPLTGELYQSCSYPGEMGMTLRLKERARIVDCEGLGGAQPGGVLVPRKDGNPYPPAIMRYPRLDYLPKSFTIVWTVGDSKEQHRQVVTFPKNAYGSPGRLLFILNEDNVWSCDLVDADDWRKVLTE